jgi:PAS domain-containing protein
MATDDFKRIFETLRVAVVVTDSKGAVQYANSTFGQLAGHEGRVLAGQSLTELFSADDRKRVSQNLARVGEGKAASAFLDAMLLPPEGTPAGSAWPSSPRSIRATRHRAWSRSSRT